MIRAFAARRSSRRKDARVDSTPSITFSVTVIGPTSEADGPFTVVLGLASDQAESIKQHTGLALVPSQAEAHPANRAIESTGGAFVEEVRGSLDYYLAQPGAARIGRVVLSGGGSRLSGLVERLTAATRLPVDVAHPMSVLKMGKTGLTDEQLAYVEPMVTVPVGLALGMAS